VRGESCFIPSGRRIADRAALVTPTNYLAEAAHRSATPKRDTIKLSSLTDQSLAVVRSNGLSAGLRILPDGARDIAGSCMQPQNLLGG